MDDGTESYGESGRGYGFGSHSFKCSDDFDNGVARADEVDVGLALRTCDGGRAESALAGVGGLEVCYPVEETCFVCDQRTRTRVSPGRRLGPIFTLIRKADPAFLQVVIVWYLGRRSCFG